MATFSELQISTIADIVGMNSTDVSSYLTLSETQITESDKTIVVAYLTQWATAKAKYVDIDPTNSNKGVRLRAETEKNDIKTRLINLLYLPAMSSGNGIQVQMIRG